jgi:hypothetical protein
VVDVDLDVVVVDLVVEELVVVLLVEVDLVVEVDFEVVVVDFDLVVEVVAAVTHTQP